MNVYFCESRSSLCIFEELEHKEEVKEGLTRTWYGLLIYGQLTLVRCDVSARKTGRHVTSNLRVRL